MCQIIAFSLHDSTIVFLTMLKENLKFDYKHENGKHLFEFKCKDFNLIDDILNHLSGCELIQMDN